MSATERVSVRSVRSIASSIRPRSRHVTASRSPRTDVVNLKRFTRESFNLADSIRAAENLKYTGAIKWVLADIMRAGRSGLRAGQPHRVRDVPARAAAVLRSKAPTSSPSGSWRATETWPARGCSTRGASGGRDARGGHLAVDRPRRRWCDRPARDDIRTGNPSGLRPEVVTYVTRPPAGDEPMRGTRKDANRPKTAPPRPLRTAPPKALLRPLAPPDLSLREKERSEG